MRPIIGIVAILFVQIAWALTPAPTFEVTSVKLSGAGTKVSFPSCTDGRYTSHKLSLDFIIDWAFDLRDYQYSEMERRLPDWAGDDEFDIEATAGRADVSQSECRLMLQALLVDRFKLVFHRDTKQGKVYDLVVLPSGHKLKLASESDTERGYFVFYNGIGPFGPPVPGTNMEHLSKSISQDGPVADKTGLEGLYKFTLRYWNLPADRGGTEPNLETALREQLGLKLQERKGPVDYLVIDHIEKPDPN